MSHVLGWGRRPHTSLLKYCGLKEVALGGSKSRTYCYDTKLNVTLKFNSSFERNLQTGKQTTHTKEINNFFSVVYSKVSGLQ
jgi:hypothetical protein